MDPMTELRVCMDIGSKQHSVVIGLSTGERLESFEMQHTTQGIEHFFAKVAAYESKYDAPVSIAMEAYNGYARPIDQYILAKGYRLFNVNNHKLAQFKKVFPGPAKTDTIDTQKMFELFHLDNHLSLSKNVLQEVIPVSEVNLKLKRITRRRRSIVEEKKKLVNRMQADIIAVSPGLLDITKSVDNLWFLNFISSRDDMQKLSRIRQTGFKSIPGVGKKYQTKIESWQKESSFSSEVSWVGDMIIRDAKRIIELKQEIKVLEKHVEDLLSESEMASRIKTITGFGSVSAAELAGEIGVLERFKNESGLALYLGMAILDNSSGQYTGTKKFQHVNVNTKRTMMIAVARHIDHCEESKKYYDKKRLQGKKHNQAVRSMGRHLVRVMWSMLRNKRDYEIRKVGNL